MNQNLEKKISSSEEIQNYITYFCYLIRNLSAFDRDQILKLLKNPHDIQINAPELSFLWEIQQLLTASDIIKRDLAQFYLAIFFLMQTDSLTSNFVWANKYNLAATSETLRLHLHKLKNCRIKPDQIAFLFQIVIQTLPFGLTSLDLSESSDLYLFGVKELAQLFQVIPSHITSLKLCETLHLLGADGLKQVLQAIPPHVTSLSLPRLGFNELKQILQAMPPHITSLNLSQHSLRELRNDELTPMLQILHQYPNIHSLNLRSNDLFYQIKAVRTVQMLQMLPPSVHFLDLSDNGLAELGINGLKQALQAIPSHITSLNLSQNGLYQLGTDGLRQILQTLPPNIQFLNLAKNSLKLLFLTDDSYGSYTEFEKDVIDAISTKPPFMILDLHDNFAEKTEKAIKDGVEHSFQKQALQSGGLRQLTGRLVWNELERENVKRLKTHHTHQNENDNSKVTSLLRNILPQDLEEFVEQQANFGVKF